MAQSAQPSNWPASAIHILYVEDHRDTRDAMSRLLGINGFRVSVAANAAEARVQCSADRFDLILMDIGLPDGDGCDLFRELRQSCDTPGIALSSYGMEQDIQRFVAAGFADHVLKPLAFEKLVEMIIATTRTPV